MTKNRKTPYNKGCSQCGLTLKLRSGFARSGVFVGGRKRSTLSHTCHTPSRWGQAYDATMNLDKLTRIDLREVWKHETSDFSVWLSRNENLRELGFELGMDLDIVKREALAGKFRVDIIAKDKLNDEIVIIENQLENSNHSHLGQLITYSSHYNSKNIVWIVKELRIEHEKAIEWLNMNLTNDVKLFLVKIELFKIGNSLPAPKFTLISKPYGWTNTLFRKEVEIEPLPQELIDYEKIKKSIIKESLVTFLDKFVEFEKKYPKHEIFEKYSKSNKTDSLYYSRHIHQFKKDLNSWAKLNDLIINKDFQDEKNKGSHKSGGIEYITFNKPD